MLMWQLRRATARFHRQNENIFKNDEHDAVTSVFQNAFSFFPWKMKRSTRARVANKYNHKVNYTHMHCVYVCWWCGSDPNNVFVIFFQHEINHVPLVFLGNRFLKHRTVALTDSWTVSTPNHGCGLCIRFNLTVQYLFYAYWYAYKSSTDLPCRIPGYPVL